jgi:hypothetical protein
MWYDRASHGVTGVTKIMWSHAKLHGVRLSQIKLCGVTQSYTKSLNIMWSHAESC